MWNIPWDHSSLSRGVGGGIFGLHGGRLFSKPFSFFFFFQGVLACRDSISFLIFVDWF